MLTAITGINWGDEGKGRMVDLLSREYDIIVRYQGGNNAGHTVVNDKGKFILNLLPSGILRDGTVNVMGTGMVIDIEHLHGEMQRLTEKGISITPESLKISDRATICMPYNKLLDILEEERLADKKFGSTRRGIAPIYSDYGLRLDIFDAEGTLVWTSTETELDLRTVLPEKAGTFTVTADKEEFDDDMEYTLTVSAENAAGRLLPLAMADEYKDHVYVLAQFHVS